MNPSQFQQTFACLKSTKKPLEKGVKYHGTVPNPENIWTKIFDLIALDCWKKHFLENNYIENYFYLLKSSKNTKTTSQKC